MPDTSGVFRESLERILVNKQEMVDQHTRTLEKMKAIRFQSSKTREILKGREAWLLVLQNDVLEVQKILDSLEVKSSEPILIKSFSSIG